MIRHIVLWKFKDNAEGLTKAENMALVAGRLHALVGIVPSLRALEVGPDILHSDMSFDMALICTFDDLAGLAAYKTHPEHVKISQYVKLIRESRATADFEI